VGQVVVLAPLVHKPTVVALLAYLYLIAVCSTAFFALVA